jgi:hypothetical protein
MSRIRTWALAISLLASGAGLGNAANLIKNGSFETPVVPSGTFQVICTPACPGQPTFPDWEVIGTTNANISIVNKNFTTSGVFFRSQAGNQYVDLTGTTDSLAAGIQQPVATQSGVNYLLTFYLGAVNFGGFGPLGKIDVYINGQLLTSAIYSAPSGDPVQTWKKFLVTFTANSTRTTILFFSDGALEIAGKNIGLDNVSLEVAP